MQVIKAVKEITGLGLKEAKEMCIRDREWMNNYPREVLGWQTAATLLRSYMSAC